MHFKIFRSSPKKIYGIILSTLKAKMRAIPTEKAMKKFLKQKNKKGTSRLKQKLLTTGYR